MQWQDIIGEEKRQTYFVDLLRFIEQERVSGKIVYPPNTDVFNAFKYTTPQNLKVVILGQDPYHGPNQAHGLCFSVLKGNKVPPSLRNIYKELATDIDGFSIPNHGELTSWANQGVLLLNSVMTVRQGEANSHKGRGWEVFTDSVISKLSRNFDNLVFLLWGSPAQKKAALIDGNKHHVLRSVHPSPLSAHRGFFGCKHFSQTNEILTKTDRDPINWHLHKH
ncbi:uracil-DNA glycosylase [Agaribacter marinus]|uniref:uracil-DNA glycosylase n=1 Tax=Agaribacter marinus TaxID=1431249 RepID=UPI0024E16A74|nr:uracil-DNA glycosylase [Agaribacter marinus]